MPEAIATTKRKFYKALDALTVSSQAPPPKEVPSISSSKRSSAAAFDEARERVRKRLRQSTSTDSLDASRSVISIPQSTRNKGNAADSRPPPNYSPWSHETFLARLKTFSSVSQWHPKPDAINEVEWAKRGWVCVDVNTVACKGGCGRRAVVSLGSSRVREEQEEDDEDEATLEEALTARYRSEIIEGHSESCLWRGGGCKDDIYRLPVVRPSIWQPDLRNRCKTLEEIHGSIASVTTKPLDMSSRRLRVELPQDVFGSADTGRPPEKVFEIAMHGWRGSGDTGNDLLCCDACFQRVGLWMYQPSYTRSRPGTADGGDDASEDESAMIDLVDMHREHCPWRNADSQRATGSLSGLNACQILHRVAATAARDFRRRSDRQTNDAEEQGLDQEETTQSPAPASREEILRQDRERDSRIRKLKNLFTIKRRPTSKTSAQKAA